MKLYIIEEGDWLNLRSLLANQNVKSLSLSGIIYISGLHFGPLGRWLWKWELFPIYPFELTLKSAPTGRVEIYTFYLPLKEPVPGGYQSTQG